MFGVVVLMLATCPSFPLLPPCCAAVAAGCRAAAATALGSSSVVTSSATGCCWLCCCLSGVTLARGVGLRWRHFLLGRRSHRTDLHNPIDLCQGALPLGHVFVEASTTRGHDEFWRNAVPDSCVPEKWYSFPLLIPQPDWDKYHLAIPIRLLSAHRVALLLTMGRLVPWAVAILGRASLWGRWVARRRFHHVLHHHPPRRKKRFPRAQLATLTLDHLRTCIHV